MENATRIAETDRSSQMKLSTTIAGSMHMRVPFVHVQSVLECFFFQAEDGIRDLTVTGVQTCALPISIRPFRGFHRETRLGNGTEDSAASRWKGRRVKRHEPEEKTPAESCSRSLSGAHRRSEEHTSELQSQSNLVCRLLLEKKNQIKSAGGFLRHVDSAIPGGFTVAARLACCLRACDASAAVVTGVRRLARYTDCPCVVHIS